jgi:hypothetical protein
MLLFGVVKADNKLPEVQRASTSQNVQYHSASLDVRCLSFDVFPMLVVDEVSSPQTVNQAVSIQYFKQPWVVSIYC